jgi:dUTP pyrophosphatase
MIDLSNQDDIRKVEETLKKLRQELEVDTEFTDEDVDVYDNAFIKDMFGIDLEEMEKSILDVVPKVSLQYAKLNEDAVDPFYNYDTDSGFDLHSIEDVEIEPLGRKLVATGLSFDIPKKCEMQVRSKSGLALKQGLMVLNSPGTVDNGYTGEVKVILFNASSETIKINKGMKIAQAVICPVITAEQLQLEKVSEIKEKDRNANGFGSTGI